MIPTMQMYQETLDSNLFKVLVKKAKTFHKEHKKYLQRKPMIEYWSRRWEYPFVFKHIRERISVGIKRDKKTKILDAGAGVTFFPFYLSDTYSTNVTIFTYDLEELGRIYNDLRKGYWSIHFYQGDLKDMRTFGADIFDIVYSVSVLEHTGGDYDKQFSEIRRILKPDGKFILTFDISLDGKGAITPSMAQELIFELGKHFIMVEGNPDIQDALSGDILTTKKVDPETLPWHHTIGSVLGSLRRFKIPRKSFMETTIFGGVFECKK